MALKTTRIPYVLKERRVAANLTHEQLACLVGCDSNTIGRIERGEGDPSVRILKRLSEIFGIGIDEMINTNQPTFASEMKRCTAVMTCLSGKKVVDVLKTLALSTRNDNVRLFWEEISLILENNTYKENAKKYEIWNDQITEVIGNDREKQKKENPKKSFFGNRYSKEAQIIIDKLYEQRPNTKPILSQRLKSLLDPAQQNIIEIMFSVDKFSYSDSGNHRHALKQLSENIDSFILTLEA